MYQLAARLSDHVDRERESWEPALLREPLILIEERQFDPTLPPKISSSDDDGVPWWVPTQPDLRVSATLSDEEWVRKRNDIPTLSQLLAPFQNGDEKWRLVNGYLSWNSKDEGAAQQNPYRLLWVHLDGYLIDPHDCDLAVAQLEGRNFFGKWMPEGATWLYGFVGEYPWGAAYNTESEEYHGRGGSSRDLPCAFVPVSTTVASEWEYDASLSRNLHISLPARQLFAPGDLWWNGRDGFQDNRRKSVIRDPHVVESGPSVLIITEDDLKRRLRRIKKCMFWTLLGEKLVIGLPDRTASPRRTFSQIAHMDNDGSIRFSKITFFDDYNKDTGPLGSTTRAGVGSPASMAAGATQKKNRGRGKPPSRKRLNEMPEAHIHKKPKKKKRDRRTDSPKKTPKGRKGKR